MSGRRAAVAVPLGLVVILAGCAARGFVPSKPLARDRPLPSTVPVTIVSDGANGCKKDGVDLLYGVGGNEVIWKVTNNCQVKNEARRVTVSIDGVNVKHTVFGGRSPFEKSPAPVDIPAGEEREIKALVLRNPPGEGYKGLNVYRYKIKIKVENGPTNDDDPEILIDWP